MRLKTGIPKVYPYLSIEVGNAFGATWGKIKLNGRTLTLIEYALIGVGEVGKSSPFLLNLLPGE